MRFLIPRSNPKLKIVLLVCWGFFGVFGAQTHGQDRVENQPASQIEITNYPGSVAMRVATSLLNQDKPRTWIAAEAYYTNDSIKDVIKHFKAQQDRLRRTHKVDELTGSLMRGNWHITKGPLLWAPRLFSLREELKTSKPDEKVEVTLGILPLADSFVRVHLMSPRVELANENELTKGTGIILVRERVPQTLEIAGEQEQVYMSIDVTRPVRLKSKPEPTYPGSRRRSVVLRAIFSANGTVTNIVVVGGGMDSYIASAIDAASRIQFEPAIKDGRYVSVWMELQYNFNV